MAFRLQDFPIQGEDVFRIVDDHDSSRHIAPLLIAANQSFFWPVVLRHAKVKEDKEAVTAIPYKYLTNRAFPASTFAYVTGALRGNNTLVKRLFLMTVCETFV